MGGGGSGIYVDKYLLFLEGREVSDPRKVAIKAARGKRGSRKATPAWWPNLDPRTYLMMKGILLSDTV